MSQQSSVFTLGPGTLLPKWPLRPPVLPPKWELIKPYVPEAKPGVRPEAYPKREILNGTFYLLRTGCAWRLLPHDLPPWRIVYYYFWQWRQDGTWQVMHDGVFCPTPRKGIFQG
jgi:transposase